jgi:pyruvate/2-oxoacid:ferredoxin oxidoreductase alpha subunit
MSEGIKITAQKLKDLTDSIQGNDDALDAFQSAENAEELLIAMGMADAFLNGAITLNQEGEKFLRDSLLKVEELVADFEEDGDDEDEEEDED